MESNDGSEHKSRFQCMFEDFRAELDEHHDRRERVTKASRDITAASKKIIFALQRVRDLSDPIPQSSAKMARQYREVVESTFNVVARELQGINCYRYQRNISGGTQEYLEALTFQHYMEHQQLLSLEDARGQINSFVSAEEQLVVTKEDYILGVFDMTGELMRSAITSMATSGSLPSTMADTDHGISRVAHRGYVAAFKQRTMLQDLQELRHRLEILDAGSDSYFSNDVDKKLAVTQSSVEKVEKALYGLAVRGSERPKGWLPNLHDGPRTTGVVV